MTSKTVTRVPSRKIPTRPIDLANYPPNDLQNDSSRKMTSQPVYGLPMRYRQAVRDPSLSVQMTPWEPAWIAGLRRVQIAISEWSAVGCVKDALDLTLKDSEQLRLQYCPRPLAGAAFRCSYRRHRLPAAHRRTSLTSLLRDCTLTADFIGLPKKCVEFAG